MKDFDFKHVLGMELTTDVIFLGLSSANNDLFIYVFATIMGCEIRYLATAELRNIQYIRARVTCTINFNVKETCQKILDAQIKDMDFRFLEGSKYLT